MKMFEIIIILVTFNIFTFSFKPYELTVCFDNSSKLFMSYNQSKVIDVNVGSTVHMWCRYCNENADYYPKLWFFKPRGREFATLKEIQPSEDITDNISITLCHTLNINNFNQNYTGAYTCKSYDNTSNDHTFTYVLDGVMYVNVRPKMGTMSQWREYKRSYIDCINNDFKTSLLEPYKSFREKYNIILNIYTIWDNWGDCKESEGHQKGLRKRLGRCRIRSITPNNDSCDILTSYLTEGFGVSCRSLKLYELAPELGSIIINIPDFEEEEFCHISQNTGNCKKVQKKTKHNISIHQVMENSHVTLMCNEIASSSEIAWFKNKKLLKSFYGSILNTREEEPRISIDANNSLHILRISKNEEGNYTCSMNGKNVKQFEVKVVSKSKLLNQEFIRYSIYLGFVLSLTMTCYCAGVCVAWHRRASFLDPLNLHKRKTYNHLKCEQEGLLG